MRYVRRGEAPEALGQELATRQAAVNAGTAGEKPWTEFATRDNPTYAGLLGTLSARFSGKCAYCERRQDLTVEHFWPKGANNNNGRRGTPARMFRWDNLLPACLECQSFGCKGSKMRFRDGSPLALDPSVAEEDPLRHYTVVWREQLFEPAAPPQFPAGHLDLQPTLSAPARERAEYTLQLLKLNQREHLRTDRAWKIKDFWLLMEILREKGPDYQGSTGPTVREWFIERLSETAPTLAPIRDLLYGRPESAVLRDELFTLLPELRALVEPWAQPATDCARHRVTELADA